MDLHNSGKMIGSGGIRGSYAIEPYYHGMSSKIRGYSGQGVFGDTFRAITGNTKSAGQTAFKVLRQKGLEGVKALGKSVLKNTLQNLPALLQAGKEEGAKGVVNRAVRDILAPSVKDAVAEIIPDLTKSEISRLDDDAKQLLREERKGAGAFAYHAGQDIANAADAITVKATPITDKLHFIYEAAKQLRDSNREDGGGDLGMILDQLRTAMAARYKLSGNDENLEMIFSLIEQIILSAFVLSSTAHKAGIHGLDPTLLQGGGVFDTILPVVGKLVSAGLPALGDMLQDVPIIGGLLKGIGHALGGVAGSLSQGLSGNGVAMYNPNEALAMQRQTVGGWPHGRNNYNQMCSNGVFPFFPGLNNFGYYMNCVDIANMLDHWNVCPQSYYQTHALLGQNKRQRDVEGSGPTKRQRTHK